MHPFILHRPDTVEEALGLLEKEGENARPLSGGTELLLLMKQGFAFYEHLVDLKRISSLGELRIRESDGALVVGGAVTHRRLERSPLVRERFPLLAEMEGQVANVRVRNTGTLAGNLAFAEPHSDPATLLTAWGATLRLRGPSGSREVPPDAFWQGAFETALRPAEVIEFVAIPPLDDGWGAAYAKFGIHERPTLGVAVFLRREGGGAIAEARVAVGCVEPCPRRLGEVEAALQGRSAAEVEADLGGIGELASRGVDPISDLHGSRTYKQGMVAEFTARAIRRALGAVRGEAP